jgi:hypothetical protein
MKQDYPREYFIELVGNPELIGRLTLIQTRRGIYVDVDLLFDESKKIFRPMGQLGPFLENDDAREQGFQFLATSLRKLTVVSK